MGSGSEEKRRERALGEEEEHDDFADLISGRKPHSSSGLIIWVSSTMFTKDLQKLSSFKEKLF